MDCIHGDACLEARACVGYKNCKHYVDTETFVNQYAPAFGYRVKDAEWIPCHYDGLKSSIPWEFDGKWLIVTDGKSISVERVKKDAEDHFFPNGRWFELEDVIKWMPLPPLRR